MSEDRLEVLVFIQTHRDKTPSIDAAIDIFAGMQLIQRLHQGVSFCDLVKAKM